MENKWIIYKNTIWVLKLDWDKEHITLSKETERKKDEVPP